MVRQRNGESEPRPRSNRRLQPVGAADIVKDVERRIADGELEPGTRLEPVRSAAADLGLAPNTVATAYRKLADRGLVYGDGRRGTFVAELPVAAHAADQSVPDGLIDLATGNPDRRLLPDLGPVFERIDAEHVLYGHGPIDPRLGSLLAADLTADVAGLLPGGIVAGETLAVVGGALDGIERTLGAHLRPGDRVAVEDPAYTSVLDLLSAMNLRTVPVAIDGSGPTPDGLEAALADGVSALIITPRAQNPTGASIDVPRAVDLSSILARHPNVVVIEDDHAGPVAGAPYRGVVSQRSIHWVVIRSVAKSLGPDLRLAALVGDQTTVNRVIGRQLVGTGWVSHVLQRIVAELLGSPTIEGTLAAAAAAYSQRRQRFIDRLANAGITAEGRSGLNVWVPVGDEAAVVAGAQQRGFAIRSGAPFRSRSGPAVRVSTAACDVDTVDAAADALIEVIGTGPRSRSV